MDGRGGGLFAQALIATRSIAVDTLAG